METLLLLAPVLTRGVPAIPPLQAHPGGLCAGLLPRVKQFVENGRPH